MSDFRISIPGGESRRLKTGGKYCPADIVIETTGGSGGDGGNSGDGNSLIATMPIPENQSVVPEVVSYVGDVTTEEA